MLINAQFFMGDSYPNFDDLSYTGLTDTGLAYTGSSTVQDVQLGSPLVLSTAYTQSTGAPLQSAQNPIADLSTYDFMTLDSPMGAETLTGASETPPSSAAMASSTPTPNVAPGSASSVAALTGLSKFGAAFAGLLGGQPKTVSPAANPMITASGAQIPGAAQTSGELVLVVVIVAVALILLMARGD